MSDIFEIKHPLARTHIFGHDEAILFFAGGPFHDNFTKMHLDIDTDKLGQKKIHRPHLYKCLLILPMSTELSGAFVWSFNFQYLANINMKSAQSEHLRILPGLLTSNGAYIWLNALRWNFNKKEWE